MRFAIAVLLFGHWALLSSGCGSDVVHTPAPPSSVDQGQGEEGEIFIHDLTGRSWDVTHAVRKYGMEPFMFENGLGPFAVKPIINATMLSPGDLNYPLDSQGILVIGTSLNGFTRAYPIEILSRFEVANEQFGEAHVAVAYWPLVNLAAVYSREIDGEILTLSASGWTYRTTFVLYDYETESLWYHLPGEGGLTCIGGAYADRKLTELHSVLTRWNRWKAEFPDSRVLTIP